MSFSPNLQTGQRPNHSSSSSSSHSGGNSDNLEHAVAQGEATTGRIAGGLSQGLLSTRSLSGYGTPIQGRAVAAPDEEASLGAEVQGHKRRKVIANTGFLSLLNMTGPLWIVLNFVGAEEALYTLWCVCRALRQKIQSKMPEWGTQRILESIQAGQKIQSKMPEFPELETQETLELTQTAKINH